MSKRESKELVEYKINGYSVVCVLIWVVYPIMFYASLIGLFLFK